MSNRYVFTTDKEWFDNTSLINPITFPDHKLEGIYPEFYTADYDLRLLVTKEPTKAEKRSPIYNNYSERYGNSDICVLKEAAQNKSPKNVFLNGFRQEHFEYLAPFIKDTTEILYLFKCRSICDLSALSEFKKLKCVFIFDNNSLASLWNMQSSKALAVLSFLHTTNLREIGSLKLSNVEYITFDSMDNSGNKKDILIDNTNIFNELTKLKHLKLVYKDLVIDR